jgi:hypothetical protein
MEHVVNKYLKKTHTHTTHASAHTHAHTTHTICTHTHVCYPLKLNVEIGQYVYLLLATSFMEIIEPVTSASMLQNVFTINFCFTL